MPQLRSSTDVHVSAFKSDGLGIKQHLSRYLDLTLDQLEQRLPSSTDDLADLHPGAFRPGTSPVLITSPTLCGCRA